MYIFCLLQCGLWHAELLLFPAHFDIVLFWCLWRFDVAVTVLWIEWLPRQQWMRMHLVQAAARRVNSRWMSCCKLITVSLHRWKRLMYLVVAFHCGRVIKDILSRSSLLSVHTEAHFINIYIVGKSSVARSARA